MSTPDLKYVVQYLSGLDAKWQIPNWIVVAGEGIDLHVKTDDRVYRYDVLTNPEGEYISNLPYRTLPLESTPKEVGDWIRESVYIEEGLVGGVPYDESLRIAREFVRRCDL